MLVKETNTKVDAPLSRRRRLLGAVAVGAFTVFAVIASGQRGADSAGAIKRLFRRERP